MDPLINILEPAPLFTLPDLTGVIHTLEQYRSRIILLNFWSAECPWALRADKSVQEFLPRLEPQVMLLQIASNANESLPELKKAASERDLPLVLQDANQQVARMYGAFTTPHFFIIDERGLLRYQGAFDDVTFRKREPDRQYVQEAVTALLEGKDPPITSSTPYGCTLVWEV